MRKIYLLIITVTINQLLTAQQIYFSKPEDTTKAKELLGWEAKVNRAEGMKITYDYFKSLSKEELSKEEHKDFSKYIN